MVYTITAVRSGNNRMTTPRQFQNANSLSPSKARTMPGAVDVIGEANSAATVTVNPEQRSRNPGQGSLTTEGPERHSANAKRGEG